MPIEARYLKDAPYPEVKCPECGIFPLEPMMRGLVQRHPWKLTWHWPFFKRQAYCAIICGNCQKIVGYEAPTEEDVKRFWRNHRDYSTTS